MTHNPNEFKLYLSFFVFYFSVLVGEIQERHNSVTRNGHSVETYDVVSVKPCYFVLSYKLVIGLTLISCSLSYEATLNHYKLGIGLPTILFAQ